MIRLLINTLVIMVCAYLLPGVTVSGFFAAFVTAVVLAVLNVFVKPILIALTLPITVMSLGLFLFVINALLIMLASAIVPGFQVDGFLWAALFSLLLTIVNSIL